MAGLGLIQCRSVLSFNRSKDDEGVFAQLPSGRMSLLAESRFTNCMKEGASSRLPKPLKWSASKNKGLPSRYSLQVAAGGHKIGNGSQSETFTLVDPIWESASTIGLRNSTASFLSTSEPDVQIGLVRL